MEPIVYTLKLERPLSAQEIAALSRAAESAAVEKYNKRPGIPDAELSLVGSALMHLAAARTLGFTMTEVKVMRSDTGKPYILGDNLYVSLSHSKNLCVCAVCDRSVGVDIEYIKETYPERVADKYLDEGECKMLKDVGTNGRAALFYMLWTRKESILKCTGEGLSGLSRACEDGFEIKSGIIFGEYALSICTKKTRQP